MVTNDNAGSAAVDRLIAEHVSPMDRANAALRRVFLDPGAFPGLVREIAREICEAETAMLQGAKAIAVENLTRPLGRDT